MISDRPYSPGMPVTAALYELRRCAGSQFDPMVVDAFCVVWDQAADGGESATAA